VLDAAACAVVSCVPPPPLPAGRAKVKKINVGRVLLGGILAGVLMFMADGFIHSELLHEHWMAAMKAAGRSVEAE
jgi:hypothetical protein